MSPAETTSRLRRLANDWRKEEKQLCDQFGEEIAPQSMRAQKIKYTKALVCLLGFGFIAATPAELYRPAPATHHPTPEGGPARIQNVQMPPCGPGKYCSELDVVRTVPEPGTLALVVAGIALMLWRRVR